MAADLLRRSGRDLSKADPSETRLLREAMEELRNCWAGNEPSGEWELQRDAGADAPIPFGFVTLRSRLRSRCDPIGDLIISVPPHHVLGEGSPTVPFPHCISLAAHRVRPTMSILRWSVWAEHLHQFPGSQRG
jgi:hypothetical protein